jgi:hypothetical protein
MITAKPLRLLPVAFLTSAVTAGLSLIACGSAGDTETTRHVEQEVSAADTSASSDRTDAKKKDAGVDAAADARADAAPVVCSNTSLPRPATDPGYRVQVSTVDNTAAGTSFPAPTKSWTVEYKFTVPPLPCASGWNPENQTVYIWGDLVFDDYGSAGSYPLSNYVFNQIVPQLMIGDTLNGSPTGFAGTGVDYASWVIEAQYFWMNDANQYFVQAGNPVGVKPGDSITTKIAYAESSGVIVASISASEGTSSITIPAPFPNESPLLFSSWKTFFEAASAKSNGLYAQPQLNVESHFVDQATLCSVLPWSITDSVIPGVPATAGSYVSDAIGSYTCPTALDSLDF